MPQMDSKRTVLSLLCILALGACEPPPWAESRQTDANPSDATPDASPSDATPSRTEPPRSAIPAAVSLNGTPQVPADLREKMGQYNNIRRAYFQAISADGARLLISTRFSQTAQVHELQSPMGARQQLTFRDEPVRSPTFLPGQPDSVLYLTDVGGAEDYQIMRLDRTKGRSTVLTDGRSRHVGLITARDGSRIAYAGNGRNGRDMDIYLGDGQNAEGGELFLEREGHCYPIEFSRDGTKLLFGHYVSINDSRLHVADLVTKQVTRITPEEPTASYRHALFGQDANTLFVTTDREGEFVELYRVELGEQDSWTPLSRDIEWNVEGISLSPDGATLAFATNEDGYSVVRLLSVATGAAQVVEGVPRGIVSGLTFAQEAPVLGFTLSTPTRPADAHTYNLTSGELSQWTRSEVGGLNTETFIEPTLVRYQTFDDREIPAFYYRPRGDGPFPVLVSIHGGPESQARPWLSAFYQYLVGESQVAVLVPNVRGSDGYGKSYLLLDNGRQREDSVRDIGALLDWVAGRDELDDERMAVYGGSYGGYMVLASLVHFADRLDAGVNIVGISSFVTFLENTREYRRDLRRAEYGDESDPDMREFLQSISPLNNTERIRSALFVAHGANDPRVPQSETDQLVEAVRGGGQDVWYMLARNEGHGFRKKENRDLFYELSVLFLEQNLGRRQ